MKCFAQNVNVFAETSSTKRIDLLLLALNDESNASLPAPIIRLNSCSPASVKGRKKNAQAERSKDKALLAKYAKFDVTLDDSQHNEMCKITAELAIGVNLRQYIRKLVALKEPFRISGEQTNSGLNFTKIKQKMVHIIS